MVFLSTKTGTLNPLPLIAILLLPFVSYAFVTMRQTKSFRIRQRQFHAEGDAVNHVIQTVLHFELVDDYDRRDHEIEKYGRLVDDFNKATIDYGAFVTNSKYFAPWLTKLLIAAWICIGGRRVLDGDLSLDVFLSTITLFRTIGVELDNAFQLYLRISSAYLSVAEITVYMNLATDMYVPPKKVETWIK